MKNREITHPRMQKDSTEIAFRTTDENGMYGVFSDKDRDCAWTQSLLVVYMAKTN